MVELFSNSEDPDHAPRSAASDLGLHKRAVHYENTPIQIYRKFHLQKHKIFR